MASMYKIYLCSHQRYIYCIFEIESRIFFTRELYKLLNKVLDLLMYKDTTYHRLSLSYIGAGRFWILYVCVGDGEWGRQGQDYWVGSQGVPNFLLALNDRRAHPPPSGRGRGNVNTIRWGAKGCQTFCWLYTTRGPRLLPSGGRARSRLLGWWPRAAKLFAGFKRPKSPTSSPSPNKMQKKMNFASSFPAFWTHSVQFIFFCLVQFCV